MDRRSTLVALKRHGVLGMSYEREFDDIVRLAAQFCGTSGALVTFVDDGDHVVKARHGSEFAGASISGGFCPSVVRDAPPLVVPDILAGVTHADDHVAGEGGMRFYAGVPLLTSDGHAIGTLSVLDAKPRELSDEQEAALHALARQVMRQLGFFLAARRERETDERQDLILASATDYAIVTIDLAGKVASWNEGARRILGWTAEEMLDQPIHLFFTEEDRVDGVPEAEMRSAIEHGRGQDERWHLRKDGTSFWASGEMFPLRGAHDAPRGFLKILRDRTRQHEAGQALRRNEARLRESEARLRGLAENIPALVWMADADGHVVWYNQRWHEYCGTTLAQMEGWGWQSVHDPLVLPSVMERWSASIADGTPFEMTFPLRGADGVFRPFLTRVQPVHDEDGRVSRWFGTNTDVTESRAAEAANARLAAIVASSTDAIISFAPEDGRIMTWNKGAERLFGYTEAEAVGAPVNLIVPPQLPEGEPTGVFAWAMQGRPVVEHETVRMTKGGENIPVSITATRMLSPHGQVMGVSGIFRDLTPRFQAEEALRESEANLRQAQKLEAIGRLAAGVAHDFNNVLQGVSSALELLGDEMEPGTSAHEYLEIAADSAARGASLTNHLLSYARKQMLQPKRLHVGPYLANLQKLLARTLGPHIAVHVRAHPATPPIDVDPSQLETALLNLAINASHAMPKGGTLTLESRQEVLSDGRRFAIVAVNDTGVGMDEATVAQAFEPFFTTKGLEGSGLGLSMVQGFAGQSGGTASISSAPGQGTTVEIQLPAAAMPDDDVPAPKGVAPKLRGAGRVLLVDDVAHVLMTTGAILEKAGFRVAQANSGAQALAILATGERFDVVVSDYAMPGLNGVDLVRQARAMQPELPALIITGYAEVSGAEAMPEAVTVMRKPFQRQQLIKAVLDSLKPNE